MRVVVERVFGTVTEIEAASLERDPGVGWRFFLPEVRHWVESVGYEHDDHGAVRALRVREHPDCDDGPLDLVTGHASARFRWLDVRPADVRDRAPAHSHTSLPLDELVAGKNPPFPRDTELVVFGEHMDDTARAVRELERRGFRALALSGEMFGGYDWLVHVQLVT